jgi:hypothetical protein
MRALGLVMRSIAAILAAKSQQLFVFRYHPSIAVA